MKSLNIFPIKCEFYIVDILGVWQTIFIYLTPVITMTLYDIRFLERRLECVVCKQCFTVNEMLRIQFSVNPHNHIYPHLRTNVNINLHSNYYLLMPQIVRQYLKPWVLWIKVKGFTQNKMRHVPRRHCVIIGL